MSSIPKTTHTDYTFLTKQKRREFFLEKPNYQIDHRRETLGECKRMIEEVTILNQISDGFGPEQIFSLERLNRLEYCFEEVVCNMTTCRELFAQIKVTTVHKNEYTNVLSAIQNKMDEKNYLKTKLQYQVAQMSTPEKVKYEQDTAKCLTEKLEHLQKVKQRLLDKSRDQEVRFVRAICGVYEKHIEEAIRQKNQKLQRDLLLLGKWHFIKDWLSERKEEDQVILELFRATNTHVSEAYVSLISIRWSFPKRKNC
jgi:hypothetical protein